MTTEHTLTPQPLSTDISYRIYNQFQIEQKNKYFVISKFQEGIYIYIFLIVFCEQNNTENFSLLF